jgi:hypothetical protein
VTFPVHSVIEILHLFFQIVHVFDVLVEAILSAGEILEAVHDYAEIFDEDVLVEVAAQLD